MTTSASPHEITLAEATIDQIVLDHAPERLIGDRAYDSDTLDERLRAERDIEMIARHRTRRKRPKTQDGRVLRRWKIDRLFAWLQNYRRLVTPLRVVLLLGLSALWLARRSV